MKTQDQSELKRSNKKIILNLIRQERPISRIEIAKQTGMSPTSITRIVSELSQIGLVRETEQESTGNIGRKAVLLDIVSDSVYTLGIHLDIEQIKICIVNFEGKIVAMSVFQVPIEQFQPEIVVDLVWKNYQILLKESLLDEQKVIAVGVGTVGLIDTRSGVLEFAPQFQWEKVPLKKLVKRRFNLPVFVDNDIKTAAFGEAILGRHYNEDVAFLGIGSGVGSAFVSQQKLMRGNQNGAGEIGHIVIDADGMKCDCGNYGCLQTHIAQWALVEKAKRYCPEIRDVSELFEAFRKEEEWANFIVNRAAEHIAIAMCILVCMYNPTIIVVGGELIDKYDELYSMSCKKFEQTIYVPLKEGVRVTRAIAQGNATAIGSALLAQYKYLSLEASEEESEE